jgi:hypothetical protein
MFACVNQVVLFANVHRNGSFAMARMVRRLKFIDIRFVNMTVFSTLSVFFCAYLYVFRLVF